MNHKDKAKRAEELSRATQAKQILQNKLFQESIQELKKIYSNALFEQTGAKDGEAREKIMVSLPSSRKSRAAF